MKWTPSPKLPARLGREASDPCVQAIVRAMDDAGRLSQEEQKDLFKRYQEQGDIEAFHRIVTCNLGLVLRFASPFKGRGVPLADLLQEGIQGLMHAIELFEVERGVTLATYAVPWINNYAQRAVQNRGRTIRVPIYVQRGGMSPELLNLEPQSLDAPLSDEQGAATVMDITPDPNAVCPEAIAGTMTMDELLTLGGQELTKQMRRVLLARYGSDEPLTFAELGAEMKVCRERVRQIEEEAKCRLVRRLRELPEFEERAEAVAQRLDARAEAVRAGKARREEARKERRQAEKERRKAEELAAAKAKKRRRDSQRLDERVDSDVELARQAVGA